MNLRLPEIEKYPDSLDDNKLDDWFEEENKTTKGKGRLYERYIGYLLETQYYEVNYLGIKRKSKDDGIDLIASDDESTWVIQCKNYEKYKKVPVQEIREHKTVVDTYAKNHPDKKVLGAFFVTSDFTEPSKIAAKEFEISIFQVKLPARFPVIKCEKENNYLLPTDDAVYDFHNLKIKIGDCYCLTINEAIKKGFTYHREYPKPYKKAKS